MAFNRRKFLLGTCGAIVGLPFLEGLAAKTARADDAVQPFALFYRRGNGVQQALFNRDPTAEPERWWPKPAQVPYGTFNAASLAAATESAIALELGGYASKLAIIRNLKHVVTGTQNGHREGYIQGLTGAGVKYPGNGTPDTFNCDSRGESLDNRIARELMNDPAARSLYMAIGTHGESDVSFLSTIDAQGRAITRAGEETLQAAYLGVVGVAQQTQQSEEIKQAIFASGKSVNDLVREQLTSLKADPRLSKSDHDRLDLHLSTIRDTEKQLTCLLPVDLQSASTTYDVHNDNDPDWFKGHVVSEFATVAGRIAVLAIACGVRRSVLLNFGPPQDTIQYREVPGAGVADFHSISHRQSVDDDPSTNIPGAIDLHHKIDRFHLTLFRGILDQLQAYVLPDGTLLDKGVAVHYSDLGSGQHETSQLPYLYVGNAGGKLATGVYQNAANAPLVKLLNTIGAAVGCKNAGGGPLDDFNAANNGNITGKLDALWTG